MKNLIYALGVLLNFSVLTNTSLAQVNYYDPQDVQILQPREGANSTVVGEPINLWCNNRLLILRRSKIQASQAIMRGNFKLAQEILVAGLVTSNNMGGYGYNPPLTQVVLGRGIKLAQNLKSAVAGEANSDKAITHFLESYYNLIELIATSIDIPFYNPGTCGYCRSTSTEAFENAVIEMAKEQIKMVNNKLLVRGSYVPFGPSKLYLKAAELMSYFASFDLRSTLYVNYYACAINELNYIHAELVAINSLPNSNENTRQQMVFQTASSLERLIFELGCW